MKMSNPIENGQWKCNDPAKNGRAECEAACKNDWHDGDWTRMKFSIKCKDDLKTRQQFIGEPSCTPRERGTQCWEEDWVDSKMDKMLESIGIQNAEVDKDCWPIKKGLKAMCNMKCKEGFEPAWSFKRPLRVGLHCVKQIAYLSPNPRKIGGTLNCMPSTYNCRKEDANRFYPLGNGSWECSENDW